VAGWLSIAAGFVALDVVGLTDGLLLPGLIIAALTVARSLAGTPRARGLRWLVTAGVVGLSVLLALAVWWTGVSPADLPPDWFALGLLLAGLMAPLGLASPVRRRVLRPLGLDPDSTVDAVAGAVVFLTLVFSAAVFVELRDAAPEAVEIYPIDPLVSLVGDVGLALAGVGFMQTRRLRATIRRLDLRWLPPRQVASAILIAALFHVIVAVMEHIETVLLPTVAALEDRFDYEFVGLPPVLGAVLVSLAAGIGEEMVFRGALQPRLGILRTALLFGAIHVQYQLPGMLMIFVVGIGMGLLKARTSTTFVICVHVVYDIGAFLLPDI
jgi:membrane protease YdiL (CAAX protease family)